MRENYLLELGGENTNLGKHEALELLKFRKYNPKIEFDYQKIIIISTSNEIDDKVMSRLSMTRRISKVIFTSTRNNLQMALEDLEKIDIGKNSFAIRQIGTQNLNGKSALISVGEKISSKNKTDLRNPEVTVLLYRLKRTFISLNYKEWETGYKRCLDHHISNRPYFSPISINPRIARAMVNLSNCNGEEPLIDPFCGTGGILIEAADMGIEVTGIDLKEKMVEFTKGNLKHYGFKGKLIASDFGEISNQDFSSIVCDPPYGIASTTGGEDIKDLMKRCLDSFQKKMAKKQRLVIAVSNPNIVENPNLKLLYKFEWYIHKSLTRNIIVLEKN